jgi:hypothetical protein
MRISICRRYAPGSTGCPVCGPGSRPGPGSRLDSHTDQEREILIEVAPTGPTARSPPASTWPKRRVKTHLGRILGKLGLRDRVQAVVYAYQIGLVALGRPGPAGQLP